MEREPSPQYNNPSAMRSSRAPPVLQVNVLYGMAGEETLGGGGVGSALGPLGSTITPSSVAPSAINLSRAATTSNFVSYSGSSTTRRVVNDGANANSGPLSMASASNFSGVPGSSTLAKPVLDPAQVRCCPLDQWIPDAHVVNCMAPDCTNNFSLFNRKHRCRMCGRVFCASCCNNLVYISAATASKAMPTGMAEGSGGGNGYGGANTTSSATPEPVGNAAYSGNAATNGSGNGNTTCGGVRDAGEDAPAASSSPSLFTPATASQATTTTTDGIGISMGANGATAATTNSIISSPVAANVVTCRVCASCSYEVQLVVSTRQENGELRRRSRGELKMIQRVLLVNIMTYLNLYDLASVGLVSADFYFMSRDNIIWYQYNMTRWLQEGEATQLSSLKSRAAALRAQQQRALSWYSGGGGGGGAAASSLADDIFNSTPVIQDATALSESEAAKRVISLHARYNYTQFLDFARRQEMARCEGLSSFSLGARILLSSPIRIALVGPSGIGKTAAVQSFLGEKPTQMIVRPTIGFCRRALSVRLAGGLSTEVTLHIYDLSGADRYEELRRFVCRHCHVIGLCYDPSQKVTLVQAADIMMALEPVLGPQPVVVCGLTRKGAVSHSAAVASAGKGVEVRPVKVASSRSTSALTDAAAVSITAHHTLAQEENRNATSLPLPDPAGAATASSSASLPSGDAGSLSGLDRSSDHTTGPQHTTSNSSRLDSAAPAIVAVPTAPSLDVSVEDAVGITVRGLSSIQCPMLHSTALFEALVQAVLNRLSEATVASTTTISEISAELTMQGDFSPPPSANGRMTSATTRSVPASVVRSSVRRRRPAASRTIVQELLNLTMQPCALDILLDRK